MRQIVRLALVGAVASVVLAVAGCDEDVWPDPGADPAPVGYLLAAVPYPGAGRDVTAVRVDIVAGDTTCDGTALATSTVPLLSTGENPAGQASTGLIVLPAGSYRACATPLAEAAPSTICARAEAPVTVVAGQTTEVLLISQCQGNPPTGAVGATVALNDPPQITAVAAAPGRSITVCDSAALSASAIDPDGDALTFTWSGAMGSRVRPTGAATAAFSAPAAGDYQVEVLVTDGRGGQASLALLMHVAGAVCTAPAAVQALIDGKCSPCHTTNAAGGLRMNDAAATFANLVGVAAVGAGCTTRTRVVPGDSAGSYLMAKVEHRMDICGTPMPRGRPMLLPAELQILSDWIAGLPH
jgi:hypothetical protein